MLKEGAYAEENSYESIEHRGGFPKETLRRLLESRKAPTESGTRGIVFRIDPEELSPEDREKMLLEKYDNPEGLLSIKALKVFSLAKAQQEFESLQEAREIVLKKNESSDTPLARVPRAIGFDEIEVDKATQERLNANGASILEGKVGIITMDWIEGKDLAAVLHEELMKLTPEGEDPYQGKMWDNPDFNEMLRALENKGFVLPEAIFLQLKNTVQLMHENNFYHNDLHLRNLILREGKLEDSQVYMIDFADATHEKKNIQEADGEFFLSDENIIKSLQRLIKTPEQKKKARENATAEEWNERIALIEKQPKALKQYESLKSALDVSDTNMLDGQFAMSSGSDGDFENFIGNLLKLSRQEQSYRDQIKKFLAARMAEKKTRSFVLNRMQALQKAIEI